MDGEILVRSKTDMPHIKVLILLTFFKYLGGEKLVRPKTDIADVTVRPLRNGFTIHYVKE